MAPAKLSAPDALDLANATAELAPATEDTPTAVPSVAAVTNDDFPRAKPY